MVGLPIHLRLANLGLRRPHQTRIRSLLEMANVYNNIVETVGGTPLVRLNKVTDGVDATILLKCEFFNC